MRFQCKAQGFFEAIYSHSDSYPYQMSSSPMNGSSVNLLTTCWGDQPGLRVDMMDRDGTYAMVCSPSLLKQAC